MTWDLDQFIESLKPKQFSNRVPKITAVGAKPAGWRQMRHGMKGALTNRVRKIFWNVQLKSTGTSWHYSTMLDFSSNMGNTGQYYCISYYIPAFTGNFGLFGNIEKQRDTIGYCTCFGPSIYFWCKRDVRKWRHTKTLPLAVRKRHESRGIIPGCLQKTLN